MWSELDRLHLVVGYLAPLFVPRRVEFALHFEPSLGRRAAMRLTTVWYVRNGFPRQLMV